MKVTIDGVTIEGTPEELRECLPPPPNRTKATFATREVVAFPECHDIAVADAKSSRAIIKSVNN